MKMKKAQNTAFDRPRKVITAQAGTAISSAPTVWIHR